MDLTGLADLKHDLIHSTEFRDVHASFLDRFASQEVFFAAGRRVREKGLELLIRIAAEEALHRRVEIGPIRMFEIPEHHFIHAGMMLNDRIGQVIYFRDICRGLLCISPGLEPGNTEYVRFCASICRVPSDPEHN